MPQKEAIERRMRLAREAKTAEIANNRPSKPAKQKDVSNHKQDEIRRARAATEIIIEDEEVRVADWYDKEMWEAFAIIRKSLSTLLLLSRVVVIAGLGLAALSLVVGLGWLAVNAVFRAMMKTSLSDPINNAVSNYAPGLIVLGLALALVAGIVYLSTALSALLLHIERNTRSTFRRPFGQNETSQSQFEPLPSP